jgi:hypothetical protein
VLVGLRASEDDRRRGHLHESHRATGIWAGGGVRGQSVQLRRQPGLLLQVPAQELRNQAERLADRVADWGVR